MITKLEREWARWQAGAIEKYEFYWATRWYPARRVAAVTGIDIEVVRDRRRYLKQLERQGK